MRETRPMQIRHLSLLLLLAGLALAAGCSRTTPVANVPLQEDAAAQYAYAEKYKLSKQLDLITDMKNLKLAREIVRQTYAKVYEFYPDDRKYTPLAHLTVIEMDAGLDNQRIRVPNKTVNEMIEQLQKLAFDYPEHTFIQAKTLYDQGLCHKMMGEFAQAQECFKQVCEQYSKNPNDVISNMAQRACFYYNQTYVNQ